MNKQIKLGQYLCTVIENLNFKENKDVKSQKSSNSLGDTINEDEYLIEYYMKAEKNVNITKTKILQFFNKNIVEKGDMIIALQERNALKLLQKMGILNNRIKKLMKDQIIQLYIYLCEFQEKLKKLTKKVRPQIAYFITFCKQSLQLLVRNFFIFYEYDKLLSQLKQQQKKKAFSLKIVHFNEPQQPFDNQKQLKQLQTRIYSSRIDELLNSYAIKEQKSFKQRQQMCRICQQKFKIDIIGKHVRYCQAKCTIKGQIQTKTIQLGKNIFKVKAQAQNLCQKYGKNDDFKRVAKILGAHQKKKSRKKIRRCSLVGVKSQKNLQNIFQQAIIQYQQQNGQHPLLSKVLEVYRDLVYLQKKLTNIQKSYQNQTTDKNSTKGSNSNQSQSSAKLNVSTKKQQSQSSSYQTSKQQQMTINIKTLDLTSSNKLYGQSYKKSDRVLSNYSIRTNQLSIKDLMKKQSNTTYKNKSYNVFKQIDLNRQNSTQLQKPQMNDIIKHYSSLHDILLDQDELGQTKNKNVSLKNFIVLRVLGQGAFGKVYLVKKKQTDNLYAMKIIKMKEDTSEKQLQNIKNQYQIFRQIGGDHLVSAPFSFSQNQIQFFILEYLPGGDLRKMLNEEIYFEQDKAKFYLAQLILAIEHLHRYSIIHRDLKPQNMILDKYGHLKLCDFGLSEQQVHNKIEICSKLQEEQRIKKAKIATSARKRRTAVILQKKKQNLIGTPDYIAPQIISHVSINNFTIDWWSLGVITYQILIGTRPFTAQTVQQVINNIVNHQIQWPQTGQDIDPIAKDFIYKLLDKDFINRFGCNGAQQIKKHPFFEGINWQNIKKQKPPVLPKIQQIKSYEEDTELRQQIQLLIKKQGKRLQNNLNNLNNNVRKDGKKKTMKLQKFVRFDILGNDTIINMQKMNNQGQARISKLKVISKYSHDKSEESIQ